MKRWLIATAWLVTAGVPCGAQMMPMGEHHTGAQETMAHTPAPPSTKLAVTVNGKIVLFSPAELQAMPQTTLTAKNGHTGKDETYTGVAVSEVLAKCGLTFDDRSAKRTYHSYVRAEGTDGYWVLFSASELTAALRETGAIVALTLDGKPLTDEGAFKMVLAGERRPARWVRNLKSLTVVTVE